MGRKVERRRKSLKLAQRHQEERVRAAREKYGLKDDATPLPGHQGESARAPAHDGVSPEHEAAVEAHAQEVEIGRAPGQLPDASPFDASGPTRFRVHRYDESMHTVEEFADLDRLVSYCDGRGTVWVQMLGITDPQVVHIVGAVFQIPMLMQEDVLAVWSRPKIEEDSDRLLAIARAVRLTADEQGPKGQQISLIAAPGVLVSFHENADPVFSAVEKRIRDNHGRIRRADTGYLLYALLDTLVDRMLYLSEDIEDAITELEDTILDHDKPDCELDEVYRIKRIVVRLARMALPMRESINVLLRSDSPLLPDEMDPYLRDLADHALRAGDRVEHARMILQDLQEYHHTLQERKTSEVMRVLTVMSSIFIPLTFVVGVYGMNFHTDSSPFNMPELTWKYGYPMCLGGMLTFAIATLWYFKRRKWL